jgi:hypothetical protein
MIRKSTRVFIWTYVSIGILIFILSIWEKKRVSWDILPYIVLSAVLYGLGLLIGLILSIIIRKPARENSFYFIGQSLSLALLIFFLMKSYFEDAQKTYAERNEITIRNTEPFIETAYEKMKSNFPSPNEYLIHTYYSIGHDSIENFEVKKVFVIYFVYNLKKTPKTNYYSKFVVFNNDATLEEFQIETNNNQEYKNLLNVGKQFDSIINKYEPESDDENDSFKIK